MNKKEIFAHFDSILREMICDNDWIDYLQSPWESDTKVFNNQIRCCAGVSRCALIDDDYEWVVKWSILGEKDYCEDEVESFEAAKNYGIEQLMAEEAYIGDWVDEANYIYLRLYAAKRAISFYPTQYRGLTSEEEQLSSGSPLAERNESIAAAFICDWGLENFELLDKFCRDRRINDIHTGNVGLIGGRIVLIDYAGFHSSSVDSSYLDY